MPVVVRTKRCQSQLTTTHPSRCQVCELLVRELLVAVRELLVAVRELLVAVRELLVMCYMRYMFHVCNMCYGSDELLVVSCLLLY